MPSHFQQISMATGVRWPHQSALCSTILVEQVWMQLLGLYLAIQCGSCSWCHWFEPLPSLDSYRNSLLKSSAHKRLVPSGAHECCFFVAWWPASTCLAASGASGIPIAVRQASNKWLLVDTTFVSVSCGTMHGRQVGANWSTFPRDVCKADCRAEIRFCSICLVPAARGRHFGGFYMLHIVAGHLEHHACGILLLRRAALIRPPLFGCTKQMDQWCRALLMRCPLPTPLRIIPRVFFCGFCNDVTQ